MIKYMKKDNKMSRVQGLSGLSYSPASIPNTPLSLFFNGMRRLTRRT